MENYQTNIQKEIELEQEVGSSAQVAEKRDIEVRQKFRKGIMYTLAGAIFGTALIGDAYFSNKLVDHKLPEDNIAKTLEMIKDYPKVD